MAEEATPSRRRRRGGGGRGTASMASSSSPMPSRNRFDADGDEGFISTAGKDTAATSSLSRTNGKQSKSKAKGSATMPPLSSSSSLKSASSSANSTAAADASSAVPKAPSSRSSTSSRKDRPVSKNVCADANTIESALREANESAGKLISSSSLLKIISRASAVASNPMFGGSNDNNSDGQPHAQVIEGIILLEEKVGDVLSVVKKCLRVATSGSASSSSSSSSSKTPKKASSSETKAEGNSEKSQSIGQNDKVAHMRLAVHCLRAVCPLIASAVTSSGDNVVGKREGQMIENAIRLLYHAIVASEDVFTGAPSSSSPSSSSLVVRMDAATLCLSSCAVLSHLLNGLGMTHRGFIDKGCIDVDNVYPPSPLLAVLMNVPTDRLGEVGPMTAVQLAKIGAQSLLSSCTVLSSLFVDTALETSATHQRLADEFGFPLVDAYIMGQSINTCREMPISSFQLLIRSVAPSWLNVFVEDASKEGIDGALSYTKRYQRLLWDTAARLEKKVSKMSSCSKKKEEDSDGDVDTQGGLHFSRLVLCLRGDSILASLAMPGGVDASHHESKIDVTSSADLRAAILEDRLSHACECAWKSATTYAQGVVAASSLDPTWYGGLGRPNDANRANEYALVQFHQWVGGTIDALVQARLSCRSKKCDHKAPPPPFPYIEYCANRALHVGPEHQSVASKMIESHDDKENSADGSAARIGNDHLGRSSCDHDGCIFSGFPFSFVHDPGLSTLLDSEGKSKEVDGFLCGCAALTVVFATLQAVNLVYSSQSSREIPLQFDGKIVSVFNALFLSASDGRHLKLSLVNQCQKILAPLKLSSRVVHVGKFVNSRYGERSVDLVTISGANLLQRVIGECYAPLLSLIASAEAKSSSAEPSSNKAPRLEMAQDCYIRAAMLADNLDAWTSTQPSGSSEFKMPADQAIRRAYKLAVGSSDENATMVAKSIGAIGKQRIERQNMASATVPMLLSAEIFASMFEKSRSSTYKLPVRFQQLSSLFESAGMPNEAITSLAFAIHYKLREFTKNNDYNETEELNVGRTMLRCVEVIGGGEGPFTVESSSDGRPESSTITSCQFFSRLMRLYVKFYRKSRCEEESLAVVPCATLADITKRSRIGKTLEKALSLESSDESSQSALPVYRVFQLLITRSGVSGLDAIAQVTFLNRALYMFGRVLAGEVANIQNDSNDDCGSKDAHDEVKKWITKQLSSEFTGFLKLALTCASKGRGDVISEQQYRQYESSIYLSASASFFLSHSDSAVSEKAKGDDDLPNLRRSAIKYAEKAKLLLQMASDESGVRNDREQLLLCAQQLAVDYYVMEVSRITRSGPSLEDASFYKDCIEAMEDIVGRHYHLEGCQNIADMNSFFAFALARMNSELQLLGNSTLAIRAAALITRLQDSACSEKPTSDSSDQTLAMSNLISSLSEGGFHGACRSLLQGFFSRNYSCGRVDDFGGTLTAAANAIFAKEDISINEMDLLATALLVHVQSSAPEHLGSSYQFLNDIIEEVRDQEDCEDASSWVHVRWILSTCQIGIAQQMEKVGDVPRSLNAYKDCSRSCRSALTFLRSPAGQSAAATIDPNTILHPHNIMHHFSVRLSQCLRDASNLYCRQGNYSKGEGYALSLVETMGALPHSTTKTSKQGASDLMSLLEASSEDDSVRRADALQFFVEIQAYSRDAVMVSSELQDRGRNPGSFVNDNNVPEKALQNVRSTMRYGDIVARGIESGGVPAFLSYHDQSYATLLQISSQDFFDEGCIPIIDDSLDNDLEMEQFEHLMSETRLRQANRLEVDFVKAPFENGDQSNASSSSSLYRIVSKSGYTSGLSRARSYYHIGLEFLTDARRNGELNLLWEGSSQFVGGKAPTCDIVREESIPTSTFSSINSARESFTKAAALAGPASTLLSRQVMRCLALVTGPDNGTSAEIGYTATALVHSSVGSTQRQKVSQAFARRTATECNDSRLGLLFGALDTALHDRSLRNAAVQSMYDEACSVLPADWRFVAFASCPTGELLVSVIYFRTDDNSGQRGVALETICIFPQDEQCGKGDLPFSPTTPSIYEGILKPFDDIMERSRSQLKDMDSSSLDRYSDTQKKRMWWEEREAIDKQLQEVIQEVEGQYFSSDALQTLILGSSKYSQSDSDPNGGDYVATMCQGFENSDNEEELECSLGNLADKFEAACAVMGDSEFEDEDDDTPGPKTAPEKMTVAQIKEELQSLGVDKSEFKQMRKAALVDLLQEKRQQHVRNKPGKIRKKRMSATSSPRRRSMAEAKTSSMSSYQEPNGGAAPTCTFLVLDEDLQRFPFEGFNCMEARSVCRVPSISFAIATLIERGQRRIRADNTKYVLDPEANLSSTKRTMLSALDSLTSKFKWTWEGVAGKIPSVDFMEAALTSHSGLFLYCGHGGGEKCFSRKQVEGLLMSSECTGRSSVSSSGVAGHDDSSDDEYEHSPRRCSSAILLMGCSSGRLVSINSSRTSPPKNLPLEYEPEGMALSYLCAGAPCVVGNLWDVTDRDIDRFCLALLEDFLDPRGDVSKSLPQCVAQARSVCKMRHIVGAAPVVYGVPVVAEKVSMMS